MMIFGEAEASYLYNTWGIKLVIWRKAWELVGLSENEPETSAEAKTLSEWLRALGIPETLSRSLSVWVSAEVSGSFPESPTDSWAFLHMTSLLPHVQYKYEAQASK